MRRSTVVAAALTLLLSACAPQGAPVMDNSYGLPYDPNVYQIRAQIMGEGDPIVRQTQPARLWAGGGIASYSGPVIDGKTILTVRIESIRPSPAPTMPIEAGQIVIIKAIDTKAIALLPGDSVSLKCRVAFEALARSMDEDYNQKKLSTWEIDFCRMTTGIIERPEGSP